MQSIIVIILIGLVGGIAVGVQSPLSSMISQRLGVIESIFIIHLGGAIAALIPLIYYGGGKISNWRTVPWYALCAGVFGLVVIFSMSYMIPRVGVATALIILLAGQLFIGTILDHFGLLGAIQRPLEFSRIFGLAIVLAGVWLTVK
ncbi:MAG: DMT family transporter [Anaerolineales bacterium]|uniref:DMT family transporter n=1 Tax=Candidatus Villigracilis proximus TaxID=3140683 RepID=UPI0031372F2B|nr:DMT family transporter [Anaerolineales bacterium]MBK9211228.1 DMT family transporter [Anaerolineales bacterium]